MRRVDHAGTYLLRHERQTALLPGEPRRSVRYCWWSGDDPGMWHQPAVSFFIGPLAGDDEVGTGRIKRTDKAIDIAT
jgi:hypothetical protein